MTKIKKDIVQIGDNLLDYNNDWNEHRVDFFEGCIVGDIDILLEEGNNKIIKVHPTKEERTYMEPIFFLYKDNELINIICPYEPHGEYINEKRGNVTIYGHETIHIIWIDNLEVDEFYTR